MKSILLTVFFLISSQCAFTQAAISNKSQTAETKGACSPIAPNNQGQITINCNGFSQKQVEILSRFIGQLSSDQAKDQDQLLLKLNEILETLRKVQRVNTPRRIPNELIQSITHSPWGACPYTHVIFRTQTGDMEAQDLASQISRIFDHIGNIDYSIESEAVVRQQNDSDIGIETNLNNMCVALPLFRLSGAGISIKNQSSRESEATISGRQDYPKSWVSLYVYIYPKATD